MKQRLHQDRTLIAEGTISRRDSLSKENVNVWTLGHLLQVCAQEAVWDRLIGRENAGHSGRTEGQLRSKPSNLVIVTLYSGDVIDGRNDNS